MISKSGPAQCVESKWRIKRTQKLRCIRGRPCHFLKLLTLKRYFLPFFSLFRSLLPINPSSSHRLRHPWFPKQQTLRSNLESVLSFGSFTFSSIYRLQLFVFYVFAVLFSEFSFPGIGIIKFNSDNYAEFLIWSDSKELIPMNFVFLYLYN